MPAQLRVSNEQIVAAYRTNGSVWKAARELGICGQSVWERLRGLGVSLSGEQWSEEELDHLRGMASECTLAEIARRLGRTYASVACKISELQIGTRYGNRITTKVRRGSGMTKKATACLIRDLNAFGGSVRQFCVQRGLDIEMLVQGIQAHHLDDWNDYVRRHSELEFKKCPQCDRQFIPMNGKQNTCSRRCSSLLRSDRAYFGGKRRNAVGLDEGVCQLCEKEKPVLSAHHIYGKENDKDNDFLIALCRGCHQIVSTLGARKDVEASGFWENLISLAIARKLGPSRPMGFHVVVDIDRLEETDILELSNLNQGQAAS